MENLSDVGNKQDDMATGVDGRLIKMEENYAERVDAALPKAEADTKAGNLLPALDALYVLEKGSRLGGDATSNRRLALAIVRLCYEAGDWPALNDHLQILSKKRNLIKGSITAVVKAAVEWTEEQKDMAKKLQLIHTLRSITEGKIYVEVERARLTYQLVQMKEAEGQAKEAAKLLLEVQVETYGSMDRKEKVEMLLEQMRLCIAVEDWTRAQIISRKISTRFFEDTEKAVQSMKIRYYQLMIQVDLHEAAFLNIAKHFLALYRTPQIQEDRNKMEDALKSALLFTLLAPHGNEQWDTLQRIKADRALEKLEPYKSVADLFTSEELIAWTQPNTARIEAQLVKGPTATGVFDQSTESGRKHWETFHTRIGEHNIRVVAKYYSQIRLERLAQLLSWPVDKTEEFLCRLITDRVIQEGAKVDRPAGIVTFTPEQSPTERLDDWNRSIDSLLDILNKTSHVILKEEMVHKDLYGRAA